MSKPRLILAGLAIGAVLLSLNRELATSADSRAMALSEQPAAQLSAASGATIEFRTQNNQTLEGVPSEIRRIPHLVLHRNGEPTPAEERTLHVNLAGIDVPPGEITLTLTIETQHTDPDLAGSSAHRIQVWQEEKPIANTTGVTQTLANVEFVVEFPPTLRTGSAVVATPTDYFRYLITLSDGKTISKTLYAREHAFLMEDQVVAPLPPLQESTENAAPQRLIVYYCDMIPFQNGSHGDRTRLIRSEVPSYVQQLAPRMVEAIRLQTNNWGFPWHATWAAYRGEDGKQLGVVLSDGVTWYHGVAPQDGHAGIALNVQGDMGCARYAGLTERLMSAFQHELFHNLQRNLALYDGHHEDVAGLDDAWLIFTEGTATLASSVGEPDTEFDVASGPGHYMLSANRFIGEGDSPGELNTSYLQMSPYTAALYWRFLYEQCGGTQVIHESLGALFAGDIVDTQSSTDVIGGLPAVMDQVLANTSCPFSTHTESLSAFARAIYALRIQGGRCTGSEASECFGLTDPNDLYHSPLVANIAYAGGELRYDTTLQPAPAGIPNSFGIDFIEITLPQTADGSSLTIEIAGEANAAARFSAQVWELALDGQTVIPVRSPVALSTTPEGHLVHRIPVLDWRTTQRLAIIIVRTDTQESADPVGAYTLTLRSDA